MTRQQRNPAESTIFACQPPAMFYFDEEQESGQYGFDAPTKSLSLLSSAPSLRQPSLTTRPSHTPDLLSKDKGDCEGIDCSRNSLRSSNNHHQHCHQPEEQRRRFSRDTTTASDDNYYYYDCDTVNRAQPVGQQPKVYFFEPPQQREPSTRHTIPLRQDSDSLTQTTSTSPSRGSEVDGRESSPSTGHSQDHFSSASNSTRFYGLSNTKYDDQAPFDAFWYKPKHPSYIRDANISKSGQRVMGDSIQQQDHEFSNLAMEYVEDDEFEHSDESGSEVSFFDGSRQRRTTSCDEDDEDASSDEDLSLFGLELDDGEEEKMMGKTFAPREEEQDSGFGGGPLSTGASLDDESVEQLGDLVSIARPHRTNSVGRRMMSVKRHHAVKPRHRLSDKYDLVNDNLGKGAYATVRTAIRKGTGIEYAVKVINKHEEGHTRDRVMHEVRIFRWCRGHPNIVQLIDWYEDEDNFYLVFEKMEGGPLLNHIQRKSCFTEEEASEVTKDIANALKFLHDRGIAHRDVKPENILTSTTDVISPVKLCDLDLASKPHYVTMSNDSPKCRGSAKATSRSLPIVNSEPDLASPVGSAEFLAPEVVHMFVGDSAFKYGKKCDMWSLGVLVYVMLCGFPPFYGRCDNDDCAWDNGEFCDDCQRSLFERIQTGTYDFPAEEGWDKISEEAKDLIRHLLVLDVSKRYSVDEVLHHPWVVKKAPQTPLPTSSNLLNRNDSARDMSMLNGNFNGPNPNVVNGFLAPSGDSPVTPTPTPMHISAAPTFYQPTFIPKPKPQPQGTPTEGGGYMFGPPHHHHHHASPFGHSQPQMINMNGTIICAPTMATTPLFDGRVSQHSSPAGSPIISRVHNGTTYYCRAPMSPPAPPQLAMWTSMHSPQPQLAHHVLPGSYPTLAMPSNGSRGFETCTNAMYRHDSLHDMRRNHRQSRETQVNV